MSACGDWAAARPAVAARAGVVLGGPSRAYGKGAAQFRPHFPGARSAAAPNESIRPHARFCNRKTYVRVYVLNGRFINQNLE